MSFFVSENLKDRLTEDDLIGRVDNNIEILFKIQSSVFTVLKIDFNSNSTLAELRIDKSILQRLFDLSGKDVTSHIEINETEYMETSGVLKILSIVNKKEDSYVTCQIVINRSR